MKLKCIAQSIFLSHLMVFLILPVRWHSALAGDGDNSQLEESKFICAMMLIGTGKNALDFNVLKGQFPEPTPLEEFAHGGRLGCSLEARNQGGYSSCWLHAALRQLELDSFSATGHSLELSEEWLLAADLYDKALSAVLYGEVKDHETRYGTLPFREPISQGDFETRLPYLVRRYGLVPKSAWTSKIPFTSSSKVSESFLFALNLLVNNLGVGYNRDGMLKQRAALEIKKFLETVTGPFPFSFEFEGSTYNPGTFAARPEYRAVHAEGQDQEKGDFSMAKFGRDRFGATEKMLQAIRKQLDDTKRSVGFSFRWQSLFIDQANGVFALSPLLIKASKHNFLQGAAEYWVSEGKPNGVSAHSVTIIDYKLNTEGKVESVLAVNSHGPNSGRNGMIEIHSSYFRMFGLSIYALKEIVNPFLDSENSRHIDASVNSSLAGH